MSVEPWIDCRDIHRLVSFYTGVLDFSIASPPDPDPNSHSSKHAVLLRDEQRLHLDSHNGKNAGRTTLYVRVDNVDALFASFLKNGLPRNDQADKPGLRGGLVDQSWGMREFWFRDPEGNTVTYGQALTPGRSD